MGFLGDLFFGKREKVPTLIHISPTLLSGMEAIIYIHNSKAHELDHITLDDVAEAGIDHIVRKSLRLSTQDDFILPPPPPPKEKKKNATPVYYVEDRYANRGRIQSR